MSGPAVIDIWVPGIPRPGGSKRAFYVKRLGRSVIVDACRRNKDWRAAVSMAAYEAMSGRRGLMLGPLHVEMTFHMPRPKNHFRRDGGLRIGAPTFPTTRPDVLKLMRSTEDALTGVVWGDDAQTVELIGRKIYADKACGCRIRISSLGHVVRDVSWERHR